MDDVRVEVSELDPRVDRLFASAMEQQLEEQRTLTRLAGRVEAALDELQRGLGGLAEHLDAVAAPLPAEVERTRAALLSAVARMERDADAQRGQMLESLERLRGQLNLSKLSGQLADLADRVEHGTAPLPGAIAELRSVLGDVLEGVDRGTAQSRSDLSEWLGALRNEFSGQLTAGQEGAVRAVAAAQRALSEQVVRMETLRETFQVQAGHAADRVAALLDHATANQREALAALAAATSQLTAEASLTREAVASQPHLLREAVGEAVAAAQAGIDGSLATARMVSEQVAHSGAASREAVERMQEFVDGLGARLEQAHVSGTHRLSQAAAVLEHAAEGFHPAVVALVDELREALFDTAAVDRAQSEASTVALRECANGVAAELRALVDDACRRLYEMHSSGTVELSSAAAAIVRASEEVQPAFSAALARLYGAVAAAATQVRATSEEAAARTDATLVEALRGIESTISDRLAQTSALSQEAATQLAEAQATAVNRLERVAETVGERATSLHPALMDAAEELRQSLLEAAEVAAQRMSAAITDAVEQLSTVQHADTGMLADAADHVARTAESLTPAVSSALARVGETVSQVLARFEDELGRRLDQSDAAAQAVAAGLLAASDDAQERLRVWLAGALPDAVAQVTVGLADQIERAEKRVYETANRLEAVCGDAGGGLQVAAEHASAQMAEAARALTAVAGESIESAERRIALLSKQLDALIERIDIVADAEGRRADTCETVLACVRDIGSENGSGRDQHGIDVGVTREFESAALRLQDTVERAQDVERRVADALDRVVDRLDASSIGLGRLEASLVEYLRERDRMAAADRERLLSDLVGQLGAAIPRKDHRLLGGLLPSGRRREEFPPDPPLNPPRSVRPESMPPEALRPDPSRVQGRSAPTERVGPRRESALVCDVCGFVGKSAAGLAAHRRAHQ